MAESEEEMEALPTLASLLQPSSSSSSPPPSGESGRCPSASPAAEAGRAAGVVVVSSGSEEDEDEVVEVAPLSERVERRVEAAFKRPQLGGGNAAGGAGLRASGDLVAPGSERPRDAAVSSGNASCVTQNGTCGVERPSLCPLPATRSDSARQPSGASPETSPPPKKSKYSQKEKEAICQAAWQRRKEREARRRQQEEEKERKRALARMLKAQRPGECHKYLTVELDAGTFPHSLALTVACSLEA